MGIKLEPCPKCGGVWLAVGKACTVRTPKPLRVLRTLHGVTCTSCGYYRPTRKSWNRMAKKREA